MEAAVATARSGGAVAWIEEYGKGARQILDEAAHRLVRQGPWRPVRDLPMIDCRGGCGAAAGVFDGVDLDWKWPASDAGEVGNHVDYASDAKNLTLLAAEFRKQLDALGSTTGEDYLLSAFLPANPEVARAGGWNSPALFDHLNYANI